MNHACASATRKRSPRTYHTAPPGRPGARERRSPGRRSRGFIPGGILEFAIYKSAGSKGPGLHRRLTPSFLEGQFIVADVNDHAITFVELALEHAHRQRIEDSTL